jgi:hypothetical protein
MREQNLANNFLQPYFTNNPMVLQPQCPTFINDFKIQHIISCGFKADSGNEAMHS